MQLDVDVQETEVSWLDPGEPPAALAGVGIVSVQAEISPAISKNPAIDRPPTTRAPRS
jgi:hypothetical protein